MPDLFRATESGLDQVVIGEDNPIQGPSTTSHSEELVAYYSEQEENGEKGEAVIARQYWAAFKDSSGLHKTAKKLLDVFHYRLYDAAYTTSFLTSEEWADGIRMDFDHSSMEKGTLKFESISAAEDNQKVRVTLYPNEKYLNDMLDIQEGKQATLKDPSKMKFPGMNESIDFKDLKANYL